MTSMAIGMLLHWTQANSFELVVRQSHGRPQECQNRGESTKGYWGDRIPKTQEVTLFTMTVYNSENSIRNTRWFVVHCFVTEMLWGILHLS